jgi:hypothetical protein
MQTEMMIRRVAGTFVLLSLAAGHWINPLFFLFTAFVGANLFQSSFTRFCPLEMALKRVGEEKRNPR